MSGSGTLVPSCRYISSSSNFCDAETVLESPLRAGFTARCFRSSGCTRVSLDGLELVPETGETSIRSSIGVPTGSSEGEIRGSNVRARFHVLKLSGDEPPASVPILDGPVIVERNLHRLQM